MGDFDKFFDDYHQPVLYSDKATGEYYLNRAAQEEFSRLAPKLSKEEFEEHFSLTTIPASALICQADDNVYQIQKETLTVGNRSVLKWTLIKSGMQTDPSLISHYRIISQMIVHQFRSPLTAVKGYLDLVKESEGDEKKLHYLNKMGDGIDEVFRFLNRAESFAKDPQADVTAFRANKLRDSLLSGFAPEQLRRISFLDADKLDFTVTSDFSMLLTLLNELTTNALLASNDTVSIRFTPDGNVAVTNRFDPSSPPDPSLFSLPYSSSRSLHLGLGIPACEQICNKLHMKFSWSISHSNHTITFKASGIQTS